MIVFSLQCSKGHAFDEWFSSSDDYMEQKKKKKLACPTCGDKKVEKGLMAPSVGKSAPAPAPACGAPACSNGACPMSGIK
ncbi:MAG: DUF1178 family protein [Rhodospirillaceae bacterium]|jgi:hypothetical protein|nr:DUF1178 family protein [Rhodospirillaceae bacterium]MBT4220006.1 DUF1178 family protein [Rhodospirillaceae bacterium]MBT4463040.1 DUF1178 family protein [Rhodospirillaceae bacterium]MBT5013186.1 DUF1178 family protein [Rhodospirillaceae bacterium]MBT5308583.1 DUF1178 family protein [Rhodospirillaceae bacterium]